MYVSITSLRLKTPFHFFALSLHALRIRKQLNASPCVRAKFKGFWLTHYTMTLWKSKEEMESFARSGAHLEVMKRSGKIASEIRTITVDSMNLMPWNEAVSLLRKGKVIHY